MTNNNTAPDESLKDYVEFREGLLYWKDIPENKTRNAKLKGFHMGANTKPSARGYQRLRYDGKRYPVHKVVYWLHTGDYPEIVDHIDQDKLNNRFENLRPATRASNRINCTSNYSIKTYTKKDGIKTYTATIHLGQKHFNIGTFYDELTALYAAWKMREILYPGFCPMPEKLKEVLND